MNDPIQILLWAAGMILLCVLLSSVKDLRFASGDWLVPALIAGAPAAAVIRWSSGRPTDEANLAVAAAIALLAFILRARRPGGDWAEGLFAGTTIGVVASTVESLTTASAELWPLLLSIVAGVAAFAVPLRLRRARFALSVATAITLWLGAAAARDVSAVLAQQPYGAAGVVAVAGLAFLLQRWPTVKRELREEVPLGFVREEDLDWLANPFARLLRRTWTDEKARREFARQATALAVQKARQRRLPPDHARLQQLETIRIRMLLQNVLGVELSMRNQARDEGENIHDASDTLNAKG